VTFAASLGDEEYVLVTTAGTAGPTAVVPVVAAVAGAAPAPPVRCGRGAVEVPPRGAGAACRPILGAFSGGNLASGVASAGRGIGAAGGASSAAAPAATDPAYGIDIAAIPRAATAALSRRARPPSRPGVKVAAGAPASAGVKRLRIEPVLFSARTRVSVELRSADHRWGSGRRPADWSGGPCQTGMPEAQLFCERARGRSSS
jgi:hypothetical protein